MKKIGIIVLFIAVVALVGGSRWMRLYNPDAIDAVRKVDIYLPDSIQLPQLTHLLVDSLDVVSDSTELHWAATMLGWRKFQPGHYKIDHGFTYDEFLSKLAKGIQDPISVTVVPGQREDQILSSLAERMRFDSTAIFSIMQDSSFILRKAIDSTAVVAHFFPATYDLYWTAPPEKVINRIFREFNHQVINTYKQQAQTGDMSLNDVLTLASIVEWEALHDDEKPKISELYLNRLHQNMLLQADPTVSYALGEKRRLYLKDYKVEDPYNTYMHKGLPPGPINNPSLSSIKAVLNPEQHDYLYMVARPDGYHSFSKTYAQHEQQSKKWRQYLKKMEKANRSDTTSGPS